MRAAAVFIHGDGREVVLTREMSSTGRLRSALDATTRARKRCEHWRQNSSSSTVNTIRSRCVIGQKS